MNEDKRNFENCLPRPALPLGGGGFHVLRTDHRTGGEEEASHVNANQKSNLRQIEQYVGAAPVLKAGPLRELRAKSSTPFGYSAALN